VLSRPRSLFASLPLALILDPRCLDFTNVAFHNHLVWNLNIGSAFASDLKITMATMVMNRSRKEVAQAEEQAPKATKRMSRNPFDSSTLLVILRQERQQSREEMIEILEHWRKEDREEMKMMFQTSRRFRYKFDPPGGMRCLSCWRW
ncbi:hypothetical protein Dimus_016051, partial [Dionaea muscipula]